MNSKIQANGLVAAATLLLLLSACGPGEEQSLDQRGARLSAQPTGPRIAAPASPDDRPVQRVVIEAGRAAPLDIQATATFQEGLLPDASYQHYGADVWAYEPDTNYEGDEIYGFGRNGEFGWPYLRFDLTGSVPDGATVLQAVVSMFADNGWGNAQTGSSHKVLSTWNEATLTYNNKPPDWDNGIFESSVLLTSYNTWWDWDITQMATDWVADPASNYGLAIIPTDSLYDGDWFIWRSDDYAVASYRPKLTIDYLVPEHRAVYVDQQPPPANMFIGQSAAVSLSFRNDGADTWDPAAGYRLGSQSPADNTTWGMSRVELPGPVAPGAQGLLSFNVDAPGNPGTYAFQWRMVHDGVQWFGDESPRVDVNVSLRPLAETCQNGAECVSGNCVDGYCCDDFCSGLCLSCAMPGREGTCSYINDGQDPDDECAGSGICGSTCNGAGACAYTPAGIDCAVCASCDGAGNCNQYEPADSDPGGQCGLCRVCPGDGPDCVPAGSGSDPLGECQASQPETCGLTGDCDGAGACAYHPNGTVCQAEMCANDVHHPTDYCDGSGQCVDSGTEPCQPYVCLDAVICRTDCVDDNDCVGDSYCSGGACAAYVDRGEACSQDLECITGHCADGVCCDNSCADACMQCDLAMDPGGCYPVPDGQDPRDDCAGDGLCGGVCDGNRACRFPPQDLRCDVCTACDGAGACGLLMAAETDPFDDCGPCSACSGQDGACAPVAAGSDPLDECAQTPPEGCQTTGACDGSGTCQLWPADTICLPAQCTDGLLEPADTCDGSGACFDPGQIDCSPYACASADACRTDCGDDTHCLPGHHCQDSACEADRDLGVACDRDGQCASGACVDGVCCGDTCEAGCARCDLAASLGTCAPVPAGQDPDQECEGEGACGGACDGAYGCALPGPETACGPCARCDGAGACDLFIEAGQDPDDACGPCRTCAGDRDECVPVSPGEDPLDECDQDEPATCGSDGACDGQGACRLWVTGTTCGPQTCLAGVIHRAPACDGAGVCSDQGTQPCAPYSCDGDNCAGPDGLARVSIEDAADGSGQPIVDAIMTTDDTLTLYAVGRDADDASLGPVVVTWRVEGEIGTVLPGPSTEAVFDPTRPGAGTIVADHHAPDVVDGQTGDLAVSAGVATGTFELVAQPPLIPADGQSQASVVGGPVRDADGNPVQPASLMTVLASAGELVAEDADPAEPGVQRATDAAGRFSFLVRAPDAPGAAQLRAEALAPGTATGEGVLYFGDGRPVADAGPAQTVLSGQTVRLDGTASLDPQGRMLAFDWTQEAGPAVDLQAADTARPTFTAPDVVGANALSFGLVVQAGGQDSDPDGVVITVIGREPDLPTAAIDVEPPAGPAPLDVELDGSGSSAAACCSLTGYTWRFSDLPGQAMTGAQVARSYPEPGGYAVELTVIDDQGHFDYARATIPVSAEDNQPPSLEVTAKPERGEAPLPVHFVAEAEDPDGQVVEIAWDFGAGYALTGQEQDHLFSQPGIYTVRVRATDDQGLASLQMLSIPVSTDGLYPPRIVSSPPTDPIAVGQAFGYQPQAVGSAPLTWSVGKQLGSETVGAPAGMQVDPATGALAFTPTRDQAGEVAVTLAVTNQVGSDFQDFTLQVNPNGKPGGGCGCASTTPHGAGLALLFWTALALVIRRRRA